ncbi:hypothetical protein GCM10009850_068830 [Nonomuraea monospora]|uniref:Transposase n=1 Tax=Nonomuraea monospora TaxID=568818 RepID=A0ABP5PIL2_9ACTN
MEYLGVKNQVRPDSVLHRRYDLQHLRFRWQADPERRAVRPEHRKRCGSPATCGPEVDGLVAERYDYLWLGLVTAAALAARRYLASVVHCRILARGRCGRDRPESRSAASNRPTRGRPPQAGCP